MKNPGCSVSGRNRSRQRRLPSPAAATMRKPRSWCLLNCSRRSNTQSRPTNPCSALAQARAAWCVDVQLDAWAEGCFDALQLRGRLVVEGLCAASGLTQLGEHPFAALLGFRQQIREERRDASGKFLASLADSRS